MRLRRDTSFSPLALAQADVIFNIFISFVLFTAFLLLTSKLKKEEIKDEKIKKEEMKLIVDMAVVATLTFTIKWPDGPEDIDLWVIGPDKVAVGYSNTRSGNLGYLRDDTGKDNSDINYEITTAQGFVPGDYTMNIHFYHEHNGKNKMPVECQVILKKQDKSLQEIYKGTVTLGFVREEKTVIQFRLTPRRKVTDVNHKYRSIVTTIKQEIINTSPYWPPSIHDYLRDPRQIKPREK